MIDSFGAEGVLQSAGWQLIHEKTYARGYQPPSGGPVVFVKVSKSRDGEIRGVNKHPVVIHPGYERSRVVAEVPGVELAASSYFNTNLTGLPKALNGGKTATAFGTALGVADEACLLRLLEWMETAAVDSAPKPILTRQAAWPFPAGGEDDDDDSAIDSLQLAAAESELAEDPQVRDAEPTTRDALIKARIGQGGYRDRMIALWDGCCAVTGCSVRKALIASHAKAWVEATNAERLDEYNGLLLTASIDRLFDHGLVSFDDAGRLLCKPHLCDDDLACLGLTRDATLRSIDPRHLPYLAAHRARHGF